MTWQFEPLGDLCEQFADGDWVESKDQSESGVRLIQTGNVGKGIFKDRAEKARFISVETFDRLRCTSIIPGDVLISRLPDPVGRSCILPDTGVPMITAVDCTIVRFKKNRIVSNFFNYYAQSNEYFDDVAKRCTGSTRSRISRSNLAQVPVPVPPISEQKRIVALLDEAFEGIATARANTENKLRNAAELFNGLRLAAFDVEGWEEKPFEQCIEDVTYTNKVQRKHFLKQGDYPIISQEEAFINGYWSNAADVLSVDRPLVLFGDHTKALKYVDFDFVLGADGVKILKPKPFLHPRFFYHQLRTAKLDSLGYSRHYKLLKELVIRYPSQSEQQRIATELDSADEQAEHLESIYTRKLAALDELKQSLLQRAFSGELT